MNIICWFSGGITSAAACIKAIEKYGEKNISVLFLDTRNEHYDSYRFLEDFEKALGIDIERIHNDNYETIEAVWYKHNSLNVAKGAICSSELKSKMRQKIEKERSFDAQVFGFEYDKKEMNRAKALRLNYPQAKPIFPLQDEGIDKRGAIRVVESYGIKIPMAYSMGFNNNNCLRTGCIQGGIGYWQKMKREFPEKFEYMSKIEHDLTDRKGKPVTICKDQSQNKNKLVFLKPHPDYPDHKSIDDMKGREPKPLVDCNGFCGSNDLNPDANYAEINFELENTQ